MGKLISFVIVIIITFVLISYVVSPNKKIIGDMAIGSKEDNKMSAVANTSNDEGLVEGAHRSKIDAVEGLIRSAVTMLASENLIDKGELSYPPAKYVTIAKITEKGFIKNWTDNGVGKWTYSPTGATLVYQQINGGKEYRINKIY